MKILTDFCLNVKNLFKKLSDEPTDTVSENDPSTATHPQGGIVTEPAPTKKPKLNALRLDDVSTSSARTIVEPKPIVYPAPAPAPAHAHAPAPAHAHAPTPTSKPNMNEPTNLPSATTGLGDFEKALAQAGQRMDTLLAQTMELTRQLKLAEKGKTDAQVDLNKAAGELTRQLALKDEQILKLDSQLDRKASFPSLRALIDVKKLCFDLLNTQKEVSREEMVKFVTEEIDSQLSNLEVQIVEFTIGTPLEKIPGDQVENDRRYEPTEDATKHNHVARMQRPCYYLERDSKRIIVAKALVILYRYNAPSPPHEAPPSNPTN